MAIASPPSAHSLVRRLLTISNQLVAIAGEISSDQAESHLDKTSIFSGILNDNELWTTFAEEFYKDRDLRREYFDDDFFGEPAWDMLLDLYISSKRQNRVSVTSACIAANCPPTTALRWLNALEERELIIRTPDKQDARRTWVELSDLGYAKMASYFAAIRSPLTNEEMLIKHQNGDAQKTDRSNEVTSTKKGIVQNSFG